MNISTVCRIFILMMIASMGLAPGSTLAAASQAGGHTGTHAQVSRMMHGPAVAAHRAAVTVPSAAARERAIRAMPAGATHVTAAGQAQREQATKARAAARLAGLPLAFEPNRGQFDRQVAFAARGHGYTLFLTQSGAVMTTARGAAKPATRNARISSAGRGQEATVRLTPEGASHATLTGLQRLPGHLNYLIGHNSRLWHTNIPTYAVVRYTNVYRGVDLLFSGQGGRLEYRWVLYPGASPAAIKLHVSGVALKLDQHGDVVMRSAVGSLLQSKPILFQTAGTRHIAVSGRFVLVGAHTVGFRVGQYNAHAALTIDPTFSNVTYLRGGNDDDGTGIAVDTNTSAVYISGLTRSTDFPTTTPVIGARSGTYDGFVVKMSSSGAVAYETIFGGSGGQTLTSGISEVGGAAVVVGSTTSPNLPVSANAYQSGLAGGQDAFLLQLNAGGTALVYGTYLGSAGDDSASSVSTYDNNGWAFVAGTSGPTSGVQFPTTSNAYQTTNSGGTDGFLTEIDTSTGSIKYSTLFGGTGNDTVTAVAGLGNGAYAVGTTTSAWANASKIGSPQGGGAHGFLFGFDPTQSGSKSLWFEKVFGGSGVDTPTALLVRPYHWWIVGYTTSTDFPMTNAMPGLNKFTACAGCTEAFAMYLDPYATPQYSTFLGGSGSSRATGVIIDQDVNAYVSGTTSSTDLPTINAIQPAFAGGGTGGNEDGFVAKINSLDTAFRYYTYVGGSQEDWLSGISLDTAGNAWVVGSTYSPNFAGGAGSPGNNADAVVAQLPSVGPYSGEPLYRKTGETLTVNTTKDLPYPCDDPSAYSLRCAIDQANFDDQTSAGPAHDTIAFNIPASDPNCGPETVQGAARTVCTVQETLYPDGLSARNTVIDGYTQPGASPNTNGMHDPRGDNAVLTIRVSDGTADYTSSYAAGSTLLGVGGSGDIVRGLSIATSHSIYSGINLGSGVTLAGNFIGMSPDGTPQPGSDYHRTGGVGLSSNDIVGGTADADRNVVGNTHGVSGNASAGDVITGNYVGLAPDGKTAAQNVDGMGFSPNGGGALINGKVTNNIISGNWRYGMQIGTYNNNGTGDLVDGNYFGTDATGTIAVPNGQEPLWIGTPYDPQMSSDTVTNNLFKGSSVNGVVFQSSGKNVFSGNRIVGSSLAGLVLAKETQDSVSGNTISNNGDAGIVDHGAWAGQIPNHTDSDVISGNTVTNNAGSGVLIDNGSQQAVVSSNTISGNGKSGVLVGPTSTQYGTSRVQISQNSIFGNTGLGIDLDPQGTANCTTANPTPAGPNDYINCPGIDTANSTTAQVMGTAQPGNVVELFAADSSGQGKTYVGSGTADATGRWSVIPQTPIGSTQNLVATVTGLAPNGGPQETSEFSTGQVTVPQGQDTTCSAAGVLDCWSADGNANDPVGGANGTLESGATYGPGYTGQGFQFDGQNAYVSVPVSTALANAKAATTVSAWINPQQPPSTGQFGSGWFFANRVQNVSEGYSVAVNHDGSLAVYIQSTGGTFYGKTAASAITFGQFQNVVVSAAIGGTPQAYINGQPAPLTCFSYCSTLSGALVHPNTLYFGQRQPNNSPTGEGVPGGAHYTGIVDDIQVFGQALTPGQIATNTPPPGTNLGLPPIDGTQPGFPATLYPYMGAAITAVPYPPTQGQPVTLGALLQNPTGSAVTLTSVDFKISGYGLGLTWQPVGSVQNVTIPAATTVNGKTVRGTAHPTIQWTPPFSGHHCAQVTLHYSDGHVQVLQRNLDILGISNGGPVPTTFQVGNPLGTTSTITLKLINVAQQPTGWNASLDQTSVTLASGGIASVTLTITPPSGAPTGSYATYNVEGYINGVLLGGISKTVVVGGPPPVTVNAPTSWDSLPNAFTISGSAIPYAHIQISCGQKMVWDAIAGADGSWSIDVSLPNLSDVFYITQEIGGTASQPYNGTGGQPFTVVGSFQPAPPIDGTQAGFPKTQYSYMGSAITVDPFPAVKGQATTLGALLQNPTASDVTLTSVEFKISGYGLGLTWQPVGSVSNVTIPANGKAHPTIQWTPPFSGHHCVQVTLHYSDGHTQTLQRNLDIIGYTTSGPLQTTFQVGNPTPFPASVSLKIVAVDQQPSGWTATLDNPGPIQLDAGAVFNSVTLTITPPAGAPFGSYATFNVEGYINGQLIGGVSKTVVVGTGQEPIDGSDPGFPATAYPYMGTAITISPYPPTQGNSVALGVLLQNGTGSDVKPTSVDFAISGYGLGLTWQPVGSATNVTIPANGTAHPTIQWTPPFSGHHCVQVLLHYADGHVQRLQRNMDIVGYSTGGPVKTVFTVGNPTAYGSVINLKAFFIAQQPDGWTFTLDQPWVYLDGGQTTDVTVTITPPANAPDGSTATINVEGYIGDWLIGGISKTVVIGGPLAQVDGSQPGFLATPYPYMGAAITVNPYPVTINQGTTLGALLQNGTGSDVKLTSVDFAVSGYGLGLTWQPVGSVSNVTIPANGTAHPTISWTPPFSGHHCVQVLLHYADGHVQRLQRNLDIIGYSTGGPVTSVFVVGNPTGYPVTIELRPFPVGPANGWTGTIDQQFVTLQPGATTNVTLTLTPPTGGATGSFATWNVEGWIGDWLIGGVSFTGVAGNALPAVQITDSGPWTGLSNTFTIHGTGIPGALIHCHHGGSGGGDFWTVVDGSGNWSLTITLGNGPDTLVITQLWGGSESQIYLGGGGSGGLNVLVGMPTPGGFALSSGGGASGGGTTLIDGGATTSNVLTFSGSGYPGLTITVLSHDPVSGNSTVVCSATVEASGAWSCTTPAQPDCDPTFSAVQTNGHGSASTPTGGVHIFIDTTPPTITLTGVTDGGVYGASVTPGISVADHHPAGDSHASGVGSKTYTLDGQPYTLGTAIDCTKGGTHVLTVVASDIAGNMTSVTDTFYCVPPPTFTLVGLQDGSATQNAKPEFKGTGIPGDVVHVISTDPVTGKATDICDVTIGTDGSYDCQYTGDPLPNCDPTFSAYQVSSGHQGASSGGVHIWIDTTPPSVTGVPADGANVDDGAGFTIGVADHHPAGDSHASGIDWGNSSILIDGKPWTAGTQYIPTPGDHVIDVTAVDKAGNRTHVHATIHCHHHVSITLTSSGTSDYNDATALSATLVDTAPNAVVPAGEQVSFSLGDATNGIVSCNGTTDVTGKVSCTVTPTQPANTTATPSYPLIMGFGGDSKFYPATGTGTFVVTLEETTTKLTGLAPNPAGGVFVAVDSTGKTTLSAKVNEESTAPLGKVLSGKPVTLTLGGQSCTSTTDASGTATCQVQVPASGLGPNQTLTAKFGGDTYYQPSSDSTTQAFVFQNPAGGQFVLGDTTVAAATASTTVNFWGSQWAKNNTLSGGAAPDAFKGFDDTATVPVCGSTWTTDPGNSSPPPATIPGYMAVIVSSSISKNGSQISGDIKKVVIVKTDSGYAGNPGHPGTGTIVATLCSVSGP